MIFTHCQCCGNAYASNMEEFPKTCAACGHIHYKNPIPVAVGLVPCEDGLLGVIRGIAPQKGKLALPGGYVDMESLEQACSRELLEETGVSLPVGVWEYLSCHLTPQGNVLIFFGARIAPIPLPQFPFELPEGVPMETEGFEVIKPGTELAFPSHGLAADAFLASLQTKPNQTRSQALGT